MHPLLQQTLDGIERATAGMTPSDLERHPSGKWSAAGILEHLAITFDGTRRNLGKCLERGTRRASRPTLGQRYAVWRVVELGLFPAGVQAPPMTVPKGLPGASVLDEIRRSIAGMDAVMADCERRFGPRGALANHPILGPLSLRQWRRFHWVHTRHHLRQIVRLRASG